MSRADAQVLYEAWQRYCKAIAELDHVTAEIESLRTCVRATTPNAQREFWLEFSWLDQEYRAAVRRLAEFCLEQEEAAPRKLQIA